MVNLRLPRTQYSFQAHILGLFFKLRHGYKGPLLVPSRVPKNYKFVRKVVNYKLHLTLVFQIKVHGQVLEGVYKDLPMESLPVEYLPDDYTGPNFGTTKQIIGEFINNELIFRYRFSQLTCFMHVIKDLNIALGARVC